MDHGVIAQFVDGIPAAFRAGDPRVDAKEDEGENVRRIQELYRAIGRGDYGTFRSALTEDVELEILGPPQNPFVGVWRGRDQVAEAVTRNFGLLDAQQPEVEGVVAQGD